MGSLILKFLVGGIAGLLGWLITEPGYNGTNPQSELVMVLTVGALIGAAIGTLTGLSFGGSKRTFMGLGLGLLFGVIGISLGYSMGASMCKAMFGAMPGDLPQPQAILARAVAIAPVGAFLGLAIGGSSLTLPRTIQGLIGGLLAGLAAGLSFDFLSNMFAPLMLAMRGQSAGEVGQPGRAMTWTLLGGAIGLFIGIVERVARTAWVRLNLGRNEGKEWPVFGANTLIGRNEMAQIPIFGDPGVAPNHAVIQKQGNTYYLADMGSGAVTLLNGQPVRQAPLTPGSQIQVGNTVLQFFVRGQQVPAAYVPQMPQSPAQPHTQMPMAQAPTYSQQTVAMPMASGQPTVAMPQMTGQPTVAMPSFGGPPNLMGSGPTLIAVDGPLLGQRFPISQAIEVGRDLPGIPLSNDPAASRRHASLAPGPGGVVLTDLGSTNGVFVNGQRVSQQLAPIGAIIKIGSTSFRVEL
jgi:pSer/pThr/pTyr-binding forkhead associated (FHA) protein